MANMSATILREIVAKTFGIKATIVKLSGIIDADFQKEVNNSQGSLYGHREYINIWSWTPKEGFVEVADCTSEHSQNADGTWNNRKGNILSEVVTGEEVFFVIETYSSYHDCNGRDEENHSWALYKAPDFKSHWASIEVEDVKRWKKWLEQ